jgi:hypothetical protein
MRPVLLFTLLLSLNAYAQDELYGDWYNIGTERLIHFKLEKNRLSSDERTFSFGEKEGKEKRTLGKMVYIKDLVCFIQEDPSDTMTPFEITVFRYNKSLNVLDMLMDCGDGPFKDTTGMAEFISSCDVETKMIIRFYPRATIEKFKTLKPVTKIPADELGKLNGKLKTRIETLVKEFGEDKLLWIAPIIFQKVLTDLLIAAGYNPMLTERQAEELFDFNYF